ncbi:TPA: hypothetical protein R4A49_004346 [Salmonella enterica subsp. enterica serovar Muenchen]|nr:hypothetical protein [Salmonella enterica subsp. enterica serovar Muenchen]HEC8861217.1 hypothetical protein [Salmonella enterica subsp. enterica serovar Muenchen]
MTIRKMAEFNHHISLWVVAYASEINNLNVLVASQQRIPFGKHTEKLPEKMECQQTECR